METNANAVIRRTTVQAASVEHMLDQLGADLDLEASALVVLFVSPEVDRAALEAGLARRGGRAPVVGCTTAGEIGPAGLSQGSLSGFSLPRDSFTVASVRIEDLQSLQVAEGERVVRRLKEGLRAQGAEAATDRSFALLLVDGLSMREEILASALHGGLGEIPLFGGSAGDGLRFDSTWVLADGRFTRDSAVVVLVHSDRATRVFKSQHVKGTDRKLVVTEADAHHRVVRELDGEPAATAYARLVGVAEDALTPEVFASNPVIVRVGGAEYVRSISRANDDGSLAFFCAIDEGLVLSLASTGDLADSLEATFADLEAELGTVELVIGCDCILRRLEAERPEHRERVDAVFRRHRVVGFATYGEQYHGAHVNQTFTGVAIGSSVRKAA